MLDIVIVNFYVGSAITITIIIIKGYWIQIDSNLSPVISFHFLVLRLIIISLNIYTTFQTKILKLESKHLYSDCFMWSASLFFPICCIIIGLSYIYSTSVVWIFKKCSSPRKLNGEWYTSWYSWPMSQKQAQPHVFFEVQIFVDCVTRSSIFVKLRVTHRLHPRARNVKLND